MVAVLTQGFNVTGPDHLVTNVVDSTAKFLGPAQGAGETSSLMAQAAEPLLQAPSLRTTY